MHQLRSLATGELTGRELAEDVGGGYGSVDVGDGVA